MRKEEADRLKVGAAWEILTLHHALGFVDDWSCAVDGGACKGDWTAVLAGRFGRVVAYECAGDTVGLLRGRFAGVSNVEVRHAGLSDRGGEGAVWEPGRGNRGRLTARYVMREGGDGSVGRVRLEALDELELPRLGLLKLDLEGGEYAALLGARKTIERCRPLIVVEILEKLSARYEKRRSDVFRLLEGWGYAAIILTYPNAVFSPAGIGALE